VDDRESGDADIRRAYRLPRQRKTSKTKAILAIEPLEYLIDQSAGQCRLVERPSLDAYVNVHRGRIAQTENRIEPSGPNKGRRRGLGAHLRQERTRDAFHVGEGTGNERDESVAKLARALLKA